MNGGGMNRIDAEIAQMRGQAVRTSGLVPLTLDGLPDEQDAPRATFQSSASSGTNGTKAYRFANANRPSMKGHTSMGIFSRTRDIIAANFNDLLEKAEDPAKMIRLIIMEMEETLVEVRASAARTIADQKEMRRQIARLEKVQEGWTEKAELALSKGREDLAKAALHEKQKASEVADQLHREIGELDDALKASEEDINKLQAKLREARARQNSIVTRLESAHQRARMREMYAGARADEAFARFELLERRVDLAEGRAEAAAMGAAPKSLEEEIAELRAADKVDAELAALKERLGKKEH